MKIAIDVDDTLNVVDRVSRASAYIERRGLPFKLKDENAAAFVETFDWGKDDVTKFMHDGGITVFTDAPARQGAREALAALQADGHEIVILTARQKEWFGNPEKLSRDWLEKRRIPYDEIVADISFRDKARYCAEHGISVIVENNVDVCIEAEERGIRAVLAIGKFNSNRAREIAYAGASWRQILGELRFIANMDYVEELSTRACPARKTEDYDGWELRFDEWSARRGNCIRLSAPSTLPLNEKIELTEERYHAENKPCRFRLTAADRRLDTELKNRGYAIETSVVGFELDRIQSAGTGDDLNVSHMATEEWYRALSCLAAGPQRSYALIRGETVYVIACDGEKPVGMGMGVIEGGYVGLFDLRVHRDYRRKGIAKKICARILAEGKNMGATKAHIQAEKSNYAASELFIGIGFKKIYEYWYRTK